MIRSLAFQRHDFGTTFVSVNGILLPGNKAVDYVRGCCTPIWGRAADPRFNCEFRGSSVLCELGGNFFCVFTAHQLKTSDRTRMPNEMYLSLGRADGPLVSGSAYLFYENGQEFSDYCDLCALLIAPSTVARHKGASTVFIRVPVFQTELCGREYAFALGYPHRLIEYTISDIECDDINDHINMPQLRVRGAIRSQSCDPPYLSIDAGAVLRDKCYNDLAGFSGGPIFSIHAKHRVVEFRGISVRAGADLIRFIPTPVINAFLRRFDSNKESRRGANSSLESQ
jgi:hypothetical protein